MKVLSVTALTRYLKAKFDHDPHLKSVTLEGEISNFVYHARSGHAYFQLKDAGAQIRAVMFKSKYSTVHFPVRDGLNVVVEGTVSVYEPSGAYQLYVNSMQPSGVGKLYEQYEALKRALETEGLFLEGNKKPIPRYVESVALVTSPTGAAVQDMIRTIRKRSPRVRIVVVPAAVQGKEAPASIVDALIRAETVARPDVIIVGRGGGSIEDLWAFNDEMVVRTVAAVTTPIISAVGHETDVVLTDFAADVRAATPTAAATFVTSVEWREWQETLAAFELRMNRALTLLMKEKQRSFDQAKQRLTLQDPVRYRERLSERLDTADQRLARAMETIRARALLRFENASSRLDSAVVLRQVQRYNVTLLQLDERLKRGTEHIHQRKNREFQSVLGKLEALSPLNIMKRGFSVVYNEQHDVIQSVEQIHEQETAVVRLQDGILHCIVERKERTKDE
ncbi:MAG: exodeoxyribonuclease VII large subunit [Bacilli bacterium]